MSFSSVGLSFFVSLLMFVCFFTFFLLSLLHHNETFSTTNTRRVTHRKGAREKRKKRSSHRCNDEAKPLAGAAADVVTASCPIFILLLLQLLEF